MTIKNKFFIVASLFAAMAPVTQAAQLEVAASVDTAQLTQVAHNEIKSELDLVNLQLNKLAKQVPNVDMNKQYRSVHPQLLADIAATQTISLTAE